MTHGQRRALKIICLAFLPAAALAVDGWFYVSMKGWTYNLREHDAAVFWPGVLMFGAVFFPLAALGFGSALFQLLSTSGIARWPIIEGRVTDGRIEVVEVPRGKSAILHDEKYLPAVTYAYEVAGTTYSNDRPSYRLDRREEAEGELLAYPVGAPLRVYYDPDDPGTSVLEISDERVSRALGSTLVLAALPFLITALVIAWH
jgi:hypothetical protein